MNSGTPGLRAGCPGGNATCENAIAACASVFSKVCCAALASCFFSFANSAGENAGVRNCSVSSDTTIGTSRVRHFALNSSVSLPTLNSIAAPTFSSIAAIAN